VFVFIPNPVGSEAAAKTITFVGEVVQGPTTTPIPRGFSIKSSVVPQAVKPDALGAGSIPAADGDTIYAWNTAQRKYDVYTYDEAFAQWSPALPTFQVGDAFYYFRLGTATNWTRTFSVNNPS
jgi:hypothetical protein